MPDDFLPVGQSVLADHLADQRLQDLLGATAADKNAVSTRVRAKTEASLNIHANAGANEFNARTSWTGPQSDVLPIATVTHLVNFAALATPVGASLSSTKAILTAARSARQPSFQRVPTTVRDS